MTLSPRAMCRGRTQSPGCEDIVEIARESDKARDERPGRTATRIRIQVRPSRKVTPPGAWLSAYPGAGFDVITRDNWMNFVSGPA